MRATTSIAFTVLFTHALIAQTPNALGWDQVVNGLLGAFDTADVVALSATRGRNAAELRTRLVRDPRFPEKARFIVVEFGNSLLQPILDRYIRGDDVPLEELQRVWRDQTQLQSWDSPVFAEFFAAVRQVNRTLAESKKLHVLGGDSPIDWTKVATRADYAAFAGGNARDESLSLVVRSQVLQKREKALVIYGGFHLFRPQFPKGIDAANPKRVCVVGTIMGGSDTAYAKFDNTLSVRERPILVWLKGAAQAAFTLNQFSWGARRFVQGKEVPLFPPESTLGDIADAFVYFGRVAGDDADPEPDPSIYRGTPYGAEVTRRRAILDARPIPPLRRLVSPARAVPVR